MRATRFEFQQRFWVFGLIFGVAFLLYSIDHTNFAVGLLHGIAPSIDPNSRRGNDALRLIFGAGAMLVFLAAWIRTWATAYLRTEVVHDMSMHCEGLVADGPYRHVRNPLYLANLPMAVGIGTLASLAGWFFLVAAMWLFVYRLILREEDGLLRSQGEAYRAYLHAVPRFWPSLGPRVPSGGGRPHWGQAFAGEMMVWLNGAAVLSFAITLNFKVMAVFFAASFGVYFLAVYLIKKGAVAPEVEAGGDPK